MATYNTIRHQSCWDVSNIRSSGVEANNAYLLSRRLCVQPVVRMRLRVHFYYWQKHFAGSAETFHKRKHFFGRNILLATLSGTFTSTPLFRNILDHADHSQRRPDTVLDVL